MSISIPSPIQRTSEFGQFLCGFFIGSRVLTIAYRELEDMRRKRYIFDINGFHKDLAKDVNGIVDF